MRLLAAPAKKTLSESCAVTGSMFHTKRTPKISTDNEYGIWLCSCISSMWKSASFLQISDQIVHFFLRHGVLQAIRHQRLARIVDGMNGGSQNRFIFSSRGAERDTVFCFAHHPSGNMASIFGLDGKRLVRRIDFIIG